MDRSHESWDSSSWVQEDLEDSWINNHENGEVDRFKARLVAKGYSQQEVLDYHDTFSSTDKMVIVKCVIALVFSKG